MATVKSFSVQNFISEVSTKGLARPNRFEVHIHLPNSVKQYVHGVNEDQVISLLCESTVLPGQTIGVKQQHIYGPNYQRPHSVDYGGEGIPMTFLVDGSMNVKALFDNWISKIVDPIQYFVYHPSSYVSQIEIYQLDSKDNPIYSVILEDAFPRNVSMMELNQAAQNQVHKLNVTFAYRRWKPNHVLTNAMRYPPLELGGQYVKKTGIPIAPEAKNTMSAIDKILERQNQSLSRNNTR
jgi:hypothetical protein